MEGDLEPEEKKMTKVEGNYNFLENWATNIRDNKGTSKHAEYFKKIAPRMSELANNSESLLARLNEAIANCDDPQQETELKAARDELREQFDKMQFENPGAHRGFSDWQSKCQKYMADVEYAIMDAQEALRESSGELDRIHILEPLSLTMTSEDEGSTGASK